jgi:hypothetical protein
MACTHFKPASASICPEHKALSIVPLGGGYWRCCADCVPRQDQGTNSDRGFADKRKSLVRCKEVLLVHKSPELGSVACGGTFGWDVGLVSVNGLQP